MGFARATAATNSPRPDRANDRSDQRDNLFKYDISKSAALSRDLGPGDDRVEIKAADDVANIRITFTSADVGNGNALDGNNAANEDGGLAVRVQAEDGSGGLAGPVSRFDDEGISFTTKGDATFDVRDLPTGTQRGSLFDVVTLGTSGADTFDESGESEAYYINGGMGNDTITGGLANDFLVGGAGEDRLTDNSGNDSFIGGGGNDVISGGAGDDFAIIGIAADGIDQINLGDGADRVSAITTAGSQVRLTFTSADVGNGNALDGNNAANEDGGLAVRVQLEGSGDTLVGTVTRTDDEGITFFASAGSTFDVRDLPSGTARGDTFQVVRLGTSGDDVINDSGQPFTYYSNGGGGNDTISGGTLADFLVGGAGSDVLNGNQGNDNLLGGGGADRFIFTGAPGNDTINDFLGGTDKIDLSAYGISSANVTSMTSGTTTTLFIDSDANGSADFQVALLNSGAPVATDYIF